MYVWLEIDDSDSNTEYKFRKQLQLQQCERQRGYLCFIQ